jgi:hypothetical protein
LNARGCRKNNYYESRVPLASSIFIAFTFLGKEVLPTGFDLVIITCLFSAFFTEDLRLVFFLVRTYIKITVFLLQKMPGRLWSGIGQMGRLM